MNYSGYTALLPSSQEPPKMQHARREKYLQEMTDFIRDALNKAMEVMRVILMGLYKNNNNNNNNKSADHRRELEWTIK